MRPRWRWAAAALLGGAALLPLVSARGQEAPATDGPGPWEEVVFLPESALAVLLERDPRGVLLDRGSYLDLFRRARAARGDGAMDAPGPALRLLRCVAEGSVEGERVRLSLLLTVASREEGRASIPLRLGGSVTAATVDGVPATLSSDAGGGLHLVVRGRGLHEAVVELVAPVERRQGSRSVRVALPAAPASRWTLTLPGRVTATAEEGIARTERLSGPDRTRLVSYGARGGLRASWREGDEGTDLPPLVRGHLRTLVEVGERTLDATLLVRLECWRSPRAEFPLSLPPDLTVLGADGEGASLIPSGGGAFTLRFPEPFTGSRTVLLRASRALDGPGPVPLPAASLPGASAVDRRVAVRFTDGLRGRVEPGAGAVRMDPSLSEQGAVHALLRLDGAEAGRAVSERPSVRLKADARVLLDLAEDGPWLAASFLYLPRGDRLYGVDPLLPEGFAPESVTVSGDLPFLRGTTPDGRLALTFPGGVAPGSAVTVTLRGRWPVEGWADEEAAERRAPLPRLDAGTAAETEGWLGVSVPPGTEVKEEETAGLVAVPVSDLRERAGFRAGDLALGWRFRGGSPGGLLRVERPEPSVTALVALLVTPFEDHLSLLGGVDVAVQRSGIREVRLTVAPSAGDDLRIEGVDVAEQRRIPGEGRDTWVVRFRRRVRDGTRLSLQAEIPLVKGAAPVPAVTVEGAARQDLLVGVAAGGELEVATEAAGLREADPVDLAPALGGLVRGLLRAWKGERGGEPSLRVSVARLPAAPLPAAFADSVSLSTVLGMDGVARTRLTARVRNADRQALEVAFPAGAALHSARVAGEAVRPVRTAEGRLLVPILPSAEPFEVMLFYEEPLPPGSGAASLRSPDLGIPGARATWTVRLPEGSIPVETTGDFAGPPPRPGVPICIRILGGMGELLLPSAGKEASAPALRAIGYGGAPVAARPMPAAGLAVEEEAELGEVPPADSRAPSEPPPPVPETSPAERLERRAARRGLFGMDLRLLEAGPPVFASRLGPAGVLDLRWRSGAGRTAAAILAGILAFVVALLGRRRGIPAPTWTILALGLFTALPLVLGASDLAAFDGAAVGTLAYALVAVALAVIRLVGRMGARWGISAAVAAAVLLLPAAARADEERKAPEPPDAGTVFVPYDPARPETLGVPERVFLPYERYRALWNDAHPDERMESPAAPVLVRARYSGAVEGRVLVLAVRYEVDGGDGGLVALPPGAAVEELLVDGVPVAASAAAPGGTLLVPVPRAPSPGARTVVEARLRWPLGGAAPGGSLRVPIPRVPDCTLHLLLPLEDPVVAVAAAGGFTAEPGAGGARLRADLGATAVLELSWQPRGADAAGGRTRFEVESEAAAILRPGLLEWSARVTVRVLAGSVAEVEADLPADLEVQSVAGPGVASWTVVGGRTLRVRLLGEDPGERTLTIAALRPLPDAGAVVRIPDLAVKGAAVERFRVSVAAADGRLLVEESGGMERTDASGGPVPGALAFRRLRSPARLSVRVDPHAADLRVTSRLHLHLGAEESRLRAVLDLAPGRRGLYEAVVPLPEGWTLEDAAGADPFPGPGLVRLVFSGAPGAARGVTLRLRGPAAADLAAPFPLLRVAGATREGAELLVSTDPGFAVAASGAAGLDAVPPDRFASWPAMEPGELRALAWRDTRGGGAVEVRREVLRPTIRPTVVADLTVLDDRVIVDALVHYAVRGGMERVFRVDAPAGVEDPWVLGEGLREVRREAVNGRQRLTVTLQAPATGEVSFRVLYDLPVPPGGALVVAGPEPLDGEGARAFLMLRALGEAEVRIGATPGLEPCDVADLPLVPAGLDPLQVLRFLRAREGAWRLPLTLAAHEMGDLPEARIHLVDAVTVADRDGSSRTRVEARLFNRARSFLPVLLPAGSSLESVIVGGVPVRPVSRPAEPGVVQVPVRVQSLGEESQVLSLTFATPPAAPGSRFERLDPRLPTFPGIPVDATTWRLLLPRDRDYSFSGNMDPVEEVEVVIARAEAYASDVARLRKVVRKGSHRQQQEAAVNLLSNARDMQDSLDFARSRMAELEQAAAEGRVDRERLVAGKRKAAELAREIEEALGEVARSAEQQGFQAGDAGAGRQEDMEQQEDTTRYATKEGQSFKKWGRNSMDRDAEKAPSQDKAQQRAQRLWDAESAKTGAGKQVEAANKALAAHEGFDTWRVTPGGLYRGPGGEEAPTTQTAVVAGRPLVAFGRFGVDRDGDGSATAADDGNLPPSGGTGFTLGVGGGARGYYRGDAGGGGGGGAGGAIVKYANRAGLVSLSPALVEEGASYSFRKLDAGAEITVTATTRGLGRRLGAAGGFLVLLGVVFLFRRWRARRWAPAAPAAP